MHEPIWVTAKPQIGYPIIVLRNNSGSKNVLDRGDIGTIVVAPMSDGSIGVKICDMVYYLEEMCYRAPTDPEIMAHLMGKDKIEIDDIKIKKGDIAIIIHDERIDPKHQNTLKAKTIVEVTDVINEHCFVAISGDEHIYVIPAHFMRTADDREQFLYLLRKDSYVLNNYTEKELAQMKTNNGGTE